METLIPKSQIKNQIKSIANNMTREEMAWTIKLLTDKILVLTTPVEINKGTRPAWWDRPLSDATLALMPKNRNTIEPDYKEELSEILEEKYR